MLTVLVDSLPVAKTDAQKLPTTMNCEKTAGNGTHPMRRRYLGRLDVMCDKFSNRLYVLKTS